MRTQRTFAKRPILMTLIGAGIAATVLPARPAVAQSCSTYIVRPAPRWSVQRSPYDDRFAVGVRFPQWNFGVRVNDRRPGARVQVCSPHARCGLNTCTTCHPPVRSHTQHVHPARSLVIGWTAVADCEYSAAIRTFQCIVDADPYNARAWVGLAVAQGSLGRENRAVRSMRRGVSIDLDALTAGPRSGLVREKIEELSYVFAKRAGWNGQDKDDLFMIAALRAMLGNERGAYDAICAAIRSGDCSSEAAALEACLRERIQPQRSVWNRHGERRFPGRS